MTSVLQQRLVAAIDAVSRPMAGPGAPAPGIAAGRGWQLWDEDTTTAAMVREIDGATHVVNAEFFILADAGKGEQIVDALERAARRGVQVNVITDMSATLTPPVTGYWRMRKRITAAGGRVIVSYRVPGLKLAATRALGNVTHRKVLAVDGRTAFVGGINFAKFEDRYHDSMVQLSGVAAARVASSQLERWRRVGGQVRPDAEQSVRQAMQGAALLPARPTDLRLLANAPDTGQQQLSSEYLRLIRSAKRRLWITSVAYSDRTLVAEIVAAARRGVDVRLIASGSAPIGVSVINWVSGANIDPVLAAGGHAYLVDGTLHRKAIVADDEAILSSYNITRRSRSFLHEAGIASSDRAFVQAIAGVITQDMSRSTPVDPRGHTLGERIGHLIVDDLHISY